MPRIEISDLPVRIELEVDASREVHGAAAALLPYLEQENLYKQLGSTMQKVREQKVRGFEL